MDDVLSHLPVCVCVFVHIKLQARTQGSKAMALSSVVTGKEVESDVITLHRELEGEQKRIK